MGSGCARVARRCCPFSCNRKKGLAGDSVKKGGRTVGSYRVVSEIWSETVGIRPG